MLARFLAAFQVSEDKIYNVGSHVSVLEVLEVNDPGKVFSTKVLGKDIRGPRQDQIIYMFLSVDGALKSYTFKQPFHRYSFSMASQLKEEDFMADHHKAPLVKECLNNLHNLVLQSIEQMKTSAELIAATAGTMMIKEKAWGTQQSSTDPLSLTSALLKEGWKLNPFMEGTHA
jgi:hypothetical protein